MTRPNFLGIGAQRSGTTWLTTHLRRHPQIWMPPIKELHYFDDLERGTSKPLGQRLRKRHKRARKSLARLRWRVLRDPSLAAWYVRFLFASRGDTWYERCFFPGAGQVCGEITPEYGPLNPSTIAHVHTLLPDARIVFIMRNPIDRAWSHFLKVLRDSGRPLDSVSDEEFLAHFDSDKSQRKGNYVGILENWRAHYPPERIFTAFFEEIAESPEALLLRIFEFLGVEADTRHIRGPLDKRVNRSANTGLIPGRLARHLAASYVREIAALRDLVGGRATQWLQRAETLIAS